MTQRVPADARLGRTRTGQNIGYRVLDLNRMTFRGFRTERVIETAVAGYYVAVGGVEAPDAGGYIVWGLSTEDIAEATIEPATVDSAPALLSRIQVALDSLLARIAALIPPQPPVIVNTAEFEAGVAALHGTVTEMVQGSDQRQQERISEIHGQIDTLRQVVTRLDKLNDAVIGFDHLSGITGQLNTFLGAYPGLAALAATSTAVPTEVSGAKFEVATRNLAALQAEVDRLNTTIATVQETSQQAEAKRLRSIEAIDRFLVTVGGQDESGNV